MIRNWLRNFMIGRYGPDQLYFGLFIVAILLALIGQFTQFYIFILLSYAFLAIALFRVLSRNIEKRRRENDRFLRYWWPVKQKCKMQITKIKSRKSYKFFNCPSCKNTLRVPKGKGKIQITCPKCGERFEKKT